MYISWNQSPFVRFVFPFMAGIITAISMLHPILYLKYVIIILLIIYLTLNYFKRLSKSYKYRWLNGIFINLIFLLIGYELTINYTAKFKPDNISRLNVSLIKAAEVRLLEPLIEKQNSFKTIGEITKVFVNEKAISVSGKIIIYFQKDFLLEKIKYGDIILIKSRIFEIPPPQNPDAFDYKRYSNFHNIYHQSYLYINDWKLLNKDEENPFMKYIYSLRSYTLGVLKEHLHSKNEFTVASSLLIGYRSDISPELIDAYSSTGTIHVLAVSGLHVAIIFVVLNFLLMFLEKFRAGKILKPILLILSIWFYAALTGFSPSVCRATMMFSFVIIGTGLKRYTNIYNTLAASAFLLLVINPYMIMDLGFQLSYMAVLGIVVFFRPIYENWAPNNWIVDKMWGTMCVSLAAQIGTLPLCLLYFHQFPVYFLFSNLIVIPVATLVLYAGILLLMISKIKILAVISGYVLQYLLLLLNKSVLFFNELPWATINGISISSIEVVLAYFVIAAFSAFIIFKEAKLLLTSLTFCVLIMFVNSTELYYQTMQRKVLVYNIPKVSAYNFIDGTLSTLIADSTLLNNEQQIKFHVQNNLLACGIEKENTIDKASMNGYGIDKSKNLAVKNNFIQFYNKRFCIVDNKLLFPQNINSKIKVDYIILSQNSSVTITDLQKRFEFKVIIVDASNSSYNINNWVKECNLLNIYCYSVRNSGAYEITL